jgi:chromosome segregation ATPase
VPEHPNDLEARVTSLEQQMTVVSAESKAALALARAADRDVSVVRDQLNGQTRLLNALRETQLEQSQTLRQHGQRLNLLENKVDNLEREMRNGFSTLNVGMTRIEALLTRVAGPDHE